MSDNCVKYICITIMVCFVLLCLTVDALAYKYFKQPEKPAEEKLEQKPINLEELLLPKFPLPLPQKTENSTYAG